MQVHQQPTQLDSMLAEDLAVLDMVGLEMANLVVDMLVFLMEILHY
jgi:hypothetical protein